jgi:hypothetical protein
MDGNEAIRSKEFVVPASKGCKDRIEVSDEYSISDTCEVQLGVNG